MYKATSHFLKCTKKPQSISSESTSCLTTQIQLFHNWIYAQDSLLVFKLIFIYLNVKVFKTLKHFYTSHPHPNLSMISQVLYNLVITNGWFKKIYEKEREGRMKKEKSGI
jgi:hypothetical protein